MIQMELDQKEIQMELDLRGSGRLLRLLRLKQRKENAGFSDLGVQYAPGTESGTANGEISELGVQGALSADSGNPGTGDGKKYECKKHPTPTQV